MRKMSHPVLFSVQKGRGGGGVGTPSMAGQFPAIDGEGLGTEGDGGGL